MTFINIQRKSSSLSCRIMRILIQSNTYGWLTLDRSFQLYALESVDKLIHVKTSDFVFQTSKIATLATISKVMRPHMDDNTYFHRKWAYAFQSDDFIQLLWFVRIFWRWNGWKPIEYSFFSILTWRFGDKSPNKKMLVETILGDAYVASLFWSLCNALVCRNHSLI